MNRNLKFTIKVVTALVTVASMIGCASTASPKKTPTGKVVVEYTDLLPSGNTEVTNHANVKIITKNYMIKTNTLGTILAPISIIIGGGVNVNTSKDAAKGEDFTTTSGAIFDNPFYYGSEFIDELQQLSDAYINKSENLKNRYFIRSIKVTRGVTRLIYEEFNGEKSNDYRLNVILYVYKYYENQKTIFDTLDVLQNAVKGKGTQTMEVIDCGYRSDMPYPIEKWKEGNAVLLKTKLNKVADTCKRKFSDQLPALLLK